MTASQRLDGIASILTRDRVLRARLADSNYGLHNDSAARSQQQRNRGVEMSLNAQNGLIHLASQHSVEETMQRLEALLKERGVTIFARINQFVGSLRSGGSETGRPPDTRPVYNPSCSRPPSQMSVSSEFNHFPPGYFS